MEGGRGGGKELWKKSPSVREELLFSGTTRCTNILGAESFTVSNREHCFGGQGNLSVSVKCRGKLEQNPCGDLQQRVTSY